MNTTHSPSPWEIDWHTCTMDSDDVALAKQMGDAGAKVGDVMWRAAKSIGPIQIEHNHWTGYTLGVGEEDAALIAAAPDLLAALEGMVAHCDLFPDADHQIAARSAIAKAKGKA